MEWSYQLLSIPEDSHCSLPYLLCPTPGQWYRATTAPLRNFTENIKGRVSRAGQLLVKIHNICKTLKQLRGFLLIQVSPSVPGLWECSVKLTNKKCLKENIQMQDLNQP